MSSSRISRNSVLKTLAISISRLRKIALAAVVDNPYAGRFSEDLDLLVQPSGRLGAEFGRRIVALLAVVTSSYRQTVMAYPSGGGAYIVAKENLGVTAGIIYLHRESDRACNDKSALGRIIERLGGPGQRLPLPVHGRELARAKLTKHGLDLGW